jgi:hypothetical protein
MDGVEKMLPTQDGKILPQAQADGTSVMDEEVSPTTNAPEKDVAMCVTLTAHSKHKSKETWVPPPVTHDFTYPSDEEIQVNPNESFTSAPCLPVTEGRNALSEGDEAMASDISPRRYTDIASRLPHNPEEMQHIASRDGASTRLKSIAERRMKEGMDDEEKEFLGPYTDVSYSGSSASLEVHSTVPLPHNLARSIPSDGENYIGDLNTAPAHMAGENSAQRGLEEQVQAQGEVIMALSTKLDNLVDLVTNLTQNRPPDGAPQAPEDPQVH